MAVNGVNGTGTNEALWNVNKTEQQPDVAKTGEDRLTKRAQEYLSGLREKYDNVDIIVSDKTDDKKSQLGNSAKDVSAVFSSREIERMAKDEKYANEKLSKMETAIRRGNEIGQSQGVTYEKGSTQNGLYSINRMNKADRSAIVEQLKADAERRQEDLMNLVHKTLSGQVGAYGKATGDDFWKSLAGGNFTISAAAKAQAQKDISEDGYWGVKQTSQRLFDFASALAGDDVDQMKKMQSAMEKGFRQATKAWGRDLPGISHDTLNAANKLFEDYYRSKESASNSSSPVTGSTGGKQAGRSTDTKQSDRSQEASKATSSSTTTDTDKVDQEIERLKQKRNELSQSVQKETDMRRREELQKQLSQVEQELAQKDNDNYRRQQAVVS